MSEDRKLQEPEALRDMDDLPHQDNCRWWRHGDLCDCGAAHPAQQGGYGNLWPAGDRSRGDLSPEEDSPLYTTLSTPPAPEAASVVPDEPGWYVVLPPDFDRPTVRAFGKDGQWWIPLGCGDGADGWMSGREYRNWVGPIAGIDDPQPFLTAPAAPEAVGELTVEQLALEECLQLGYSIENGALLPPDSPEWNALATTCLRKKGVLRG